MKERLAIGLAGLCLGVLSACSEVRLDESSQGEAAQVDPVTGAVFCYECPVALGRVTSITRVPIADVKTGAFYCPACEDVGYCGDGLCNGSETCDWCSYDCGGCFPSTWCGDGTCNGGETSASCPADCSTSSIAVLGRFSRYCGKVNSHQSPGGSWMTDSDCTSGCNIGGLSYCQKFWPSATVIRQVAVSAKPNNVWTNAGCGPVVDDWDGNDEFECLTESAPNSVAVIYANIPIVYETVNNILRFNSAEDLNAVVNQLEADYEAYNANYESAYPGLTAEQLDAVDEQNGFDEFAPFRSFERQFPGFVSKRAQIEAVEQKWLASDLSSDDPDLFDMTFDDAENALFNSNYDLKIGSTTYRMTESGMAAVSGAPLAASQVDCIRKAEIETKNITGNSVVALNDGCVTNKRTVKSQYDGDRKWKKKVAIHFSVVRSSVKTKVVAYKKKGGGGYKRTRDMLAVSVVGTLYAGGCTNPSNVGKRNPFSGFKKRRQLKVREGEFGTIYRTRYGELVGHFATPSVAGSVVLE